MHLCVSSRAIAFLYDMDFNPEIPDMSQIQSLLCLNQWQDPDTDSV
jgi:hypothetical protein